METSIGNTGSRHSIKTERPCQGEELDTQGVEEAEVSSRKYCLAELHTGKEHHTGAISVGHHTGFCCCYCCCFFPVY